MIRSPLDDIESRPERIGQLAHQSFVAAAAADDGPAPDRAGLDCEPFGDIGGRKGHALHEAAADCRRCCTGPQAGDHAAGMRGPDGRAFAREIWPDERDSAIILAIALCDESIRKGQA